MTTPAVVYRHRATRSLRAKATMIVLRIRPPRRWTRSWNHRLSAEVGCGFRANTLQLHQHGRRRGHLLTGRLEQGVPFRRDTLQLRQHDLEPIQLADDLRLQVHRQGPTVTGPQVLQTLTPTLAQRL